MAYHRFQEIEVHDMSGENIEAMYRDGFVFTRLGPSLMHQVRSVRVPLVSFALSSENRRILKKHERLTVAISRLENFPYDWRIGKMAQDFYRMRIGPGIMSTNKIRAMMTNPVCTGFNAVGAYGWQGYQSAVGYALLLETESFIHYAYPFHDLAFAKENNLSSLGIAMMTKMAVTAQSHGKSYLYLGSIQDERSLYKFQFKGIEWFDGKRWQEGKPALSALMAQ